MARNLEARLRLRVRDGAGVFAATDDPSIASSAALTRFGIATLGDFMHTRKMAAEAVRSALDKNRAAPQSGDSQLAAALADVVLDQHVCARADYFLLNVFSTFSSLVAMRVGLRRGLGYVRALSGERQSKIGVQVSRPFGLQPT